MEITTAAETDIETDLLPAKRERKKKTFKDFEGMHVSNFWNRVD